MILSGGSGTRLWPLSTRERPKQLHALVGTETLLQATVRRVRGALGPVEPIVVCNMSHSDEISRQIAEVGGATRAVVLEPVGRNTAPAVAAAAMLLEPDEVMVVLPADHVIADEAAFARSLATAIEVAVERDLVVFGVVPTRPDTGFGYIRPGSPVSAESREVTEFVEKPDRPTAVRLIEEGCLWNSGMFVFTAGTVLEEMERWEPEVVARVEEALAQATGADELLLGPEFGQSPAISIDHAVMERTDRARVVTLDAGWSDLGSWQAIWEAVSPDGGTVTVGEVLAIDAERSYIHSEDRPIVVIGLEDVVVVETSQGILVADRRQAQEVRQAADWIARRETGDFPGSE